MNEKISEKRLARMIADEIGNISYAKSEKFLSVFKKQILEEVSKGDKVNLKSFGNFHLFVRHARMGVNPQNGERIKMERTPVMKFTTGSKTKRFIKRNADTRNEPKLK